MDSVPGLDALTSRLPKGRLVRIAVALVLLGVFYVVMNAWQVRSAANSDGAQPADAIVVLGAAQYDGVPSPVLAARLDHAYALYDQGLAPLIVTTGSNQEGDRFTQGFAGYDYLRDRGVPDADIVVIVDGASTYEELAATQRQADRFEIETVILVSDPYHAFRSKKIAEEVGLDPVVSPTSSGTSLRQLTRETAAVSIGRIVSFRRLNSWL